VSQARDYRKGATRRPPSRKGMPAWFWAIIGLAGGLAVAGIYSHFKNRPPRDAVTARPNKRGPISENDLPEPEPGRFTYDETLKNNRVQIPDKNAEPHRDTRPLPELRPGTYVLQIGAYSTEGEADRQRAKLAMIGVESKIQPVVANDQTLYRVRVGPYKSLDELNKIRARLRSAEIESSQMRLSD